MRYSRPAKIHHLRWWHCAKSVQIRSYFWSVFSCIRIEYGNLLCKSPYLDTFHAVNYMILVCRDEIQCVQSEQKSLHDYMRKSNFVLARRNSFSPDTCLDLFIFFCFSYSFIIFFCLLLLFSFSFVRMS